MGQTTFKFVEIIRKTLKGVESFAKNIKLSARFAYLKEECPILVAYLFCSSQITKGICNLASDNVAIRRPQRSSLSGGKDLLDALEL